MFVVKLFLLLSVFCALVCCGNVISCCDADHDPGTDESWFVYAPPDITVQCHLNNGYTIPENVDPDLTGYGWEINGCNYAMAAICPGGTEWCGADNDDFDGDEDDSELGLGTNSPVTQFQDSAGTVSCGLAQSFTRTWFSTTSCNGVNQLTVTQVVSIIDNVAPTLCGPEDLSYECGTAQPALTISTLNNYFGSPDVVDFCEALDDTDIVHQASILGNVITRQFTISDGCNQATATQRINLVDTSPPILERLNNVRLECGQAIPNTPPTADDICYLSTLGAILPSDVTYLGDCAGQYSIERTWSVSDSVGNTAYETQIIIVDDTTPPVIAPPVTSTVNVHTVACFDDVIVGGYNQVDICSGTPTGVVPFEISLSHNENEGRTEVLVRYTSADGCGNSQTWADLWQVDSGIGVFSDVISGPTSPVPKGTTFTISIDVTATNDCAPFGILLVDAGFATLVSTSSPCFFQSATGIIFCDPVPGTPGILTLDLTVPSTYIGSDLIISVSWQYNYRTIGVLVGSYVVSFLP